MLGFVTHHPDELLRNEPELKGHLAAGRATPHIGATFALDDVAAALQLVAGGQAIGKVVVDVAGG
jgi:NADPH2:quinone reductase